MEMNLRKATTDDVLALRDRICERARTLLDAGRTREAVEALSELELATVDDRTLGLTDPWLRQIAGPRTIVSTCDPDRRPAAGEVVVVYGNYPHAFMNVVSNNPIRRHVADFGILPSDTVEFDRRWAQIDRIFVINAEHRTDRLDSVLRELAVARAPLDRVVRQRAVIARKEEWGAAAGQIGCLRSHIEVLRAAADAGCEHALIVEDDFCFTSDLDTHLTDLETFTRRNYPYWVCLVATSKYGPVVPHDDLVSLSFQACTNTGGYLVSRAGVREVLAVFEQSLEQLKATRLCDVYAVDRCWRVLQESDRFMVFRRKFGFQGATFSDIEHNIARYLD